MNHWICLVVGVILVSSCSAADYLIMSRAAGSSPTALYRINTDGTGTQQTIRNFTTYTIAVVCDSSADVIFYVDLLSDGTGGSTPRLQRCDMAGGNNQLLLNNGGAYGLEVDSTNQKLYYTSESSGRIVIGVMNYDGTGARNLYTAPNIQHLGIYGLVLDVTNQKVYWTQTDGEISAMNADGTGVEVLLTLSDATAVPQSLALDQAAGKLYWVQANPSATDAGLNVLTIQTKTSVHITTTYTSLSFVVVHNDKLYFIASPTAGVQENTIRSSDLSGNGEVEVVASDGGLIPAIATYTGAGGAKTSSLVMTLALLLLGLLTINH